MSNFIPSLFLKDTGEAFNKTITYPTINDKETGWSTSLARPLDFFGGKGDNRRSGCTIRKSGCGMTFSNRYQLHDVLGSGGMGRVYRAYDRLNDRIVALKRVVLPPTKLQFGAENIDGNPQIALGREFKFLASLRHPNIISVLDYGFDGENHPFYTMPFLEDAIHLLDIQDTATDETKIRYLMQLLEGLAYLHRRGILHRDLKPGNLMIADDTLRIIDFGLAMRLDSYQPMAGTLQYMAPEQFEGYPASELTDLYAVGVIAYELFTGHYPFELGESVRKFVDDVLHTAPDVNRLPDGVAQVIARLLEKYPHSRYPSAFNALNDLRQLTGDTTRLETADVRENLLKAADFVGRDEDFLRLTDALRRACDGEGSAWLIGGESGIGKSRLMEEVRVAALVEGVTVLHGQGVEGNNNPLDVWREVMRQLVLEIDVPDEMAAVLKPLCPDIQNLLGREVSDPPSTPSPSEQLLRTIIAAFHMLDVPALLLLDDLQWASSLEAMHLLMEDIDQLPLLIIGAYRNEESPDLPAQLPKAFLITLDRIDPPDIARLSKSMLGDVGERPAVIELLEQETEGNLFFIVEIVRTLADEAGSLSAIGDVTLPPSVFAGGVTRIVVHRLHRVPGWGQPLLKLSAVIGRFIDLTLLHDLAVEHLPAEYNIDDWLNACADVAVLNIANGSWRFAHDKLREELLANLGSDERPHLHRIVAEAIERGYSGDNRQAARLMEHWYQAGSVVKEAYYARMAATYALQMSQFLNVRQYAGRALRLNPTTVEKAELYIQLSQADFFLGHLVDAYQHARLGINMAGTAQEPLLMAEGLTWLGSSAESQGNLAEAREAFTHAYRLYQEAGDEFGKMTVIINLARNASNRGDREATSHYTTEALDLSRKLNHPHITARALRRMAVDAHINGNFNEAIQLEHKASEIFEQLSDAYSVCICYSHIGLMNKTWGYLDEALEWSQRALKMAEGLHLLATVALSQACLGEIYRYKGDFDLAFRYHGQSIEIFRDMNSKWGYANNLVSLGKLHEELEDYAKARTLYEKALGIAREVNTRWGIIEVLCQLVYLYSSLGEPDNARPNLVESIALARQTPDYSLMVDVIGASAAYFYACGDKNRGSMLAQSLYRQDLLPVDTQMRLAALPIVEFDQEPADIDQVFLELAQEFDR